MKLPRLRGRILAGYLAGAAATFAAGLVLLRDSPYPVQDALFLTGALFLLVAGFFLALTLGGYDLIAFGFGRVVEVLRQGRRYGDEPRPTYDEYRQSRARTMAWEPVAVALLFLLLAVGGRLLVKA